MTVPFEAIDEILSGAKRIYQESGSVLNATGDLPIGALMGFRDTMQGNGNALRGHFGTLMAIDAANPLAPTAAEVAAINTRLEGLLVGRVVPPEPDNAVTLFNTVFAQGSAVMDIIENDDGSGGIVDQHSGCERTLNRATNFYEPLMITKAQRASLDTAIRALRATIAPLFE